MRWRRAPDLFDPPESAVLINLVQCARWAGVAPWELARQPVVWLDAILTAMEMENEVISARDKSRRAGR